MTKHLFEQAFEYILKALLHQMPGNKPFSLFVTSFPYFALAEIVEFYHRILDMPMKPENNSC